MNKLRTIVFLLFVSLVSTPSYAGSEDFGGVYIGVSGSAMGGELDGKYTDSSSEVTKGTGGFVESPIAGLDLGYNMALGESMVVGLGLSWTPGDATIGKADDFNDAADITLEASEFITYYIQPMIAVNEHSAIFIKYGEAEADLKVTGDFTGAASNDLSGTTTSVGTVSKFASGMYMQVEAGLTEYDTISVKDIGNAGNNGSKGDAEAEPSVAYGTVTIGYNF